MVFPCDHPGCRHIFFSRQSLSDHMNTHTGNRNSCPYSYCSKTYSNSANVRRHVRDYHRPMDDEVERVRKETQEREEAKRRAEALQQRNDILQKQLDEICRQLQN